jgi:zinc D-Ala-D-Ala dipeptidase
VRCLSLAVTVAIACSSKSPPIVERRAVSSAAPTEPRLPLLSSHGQVVVAVIDNWQSTTAMIQFWQRGSDGRWLADGESWQGVIGRSGAAWGVGLHGDGAPAVFSADHRDVKIEGDLRSPAGVFSLTAAYGYAANETSKLPYRATDSSWRCVDDSNSSRYNRVFDSRGIAVDWKSAETMRRDDDLYSLVIEAAHNPDAHAASGSCIFLHVWRNNQSPTVGCTAMPASNVRWLLAKLDPALHPVLVLLPRATYVEVATAWGLPQLSL